MDLVRSFFGDNTNVSLIHLPVPVVHPDAKPKICEELGLTASQLASILSCACALVDTPDGRKVLSEEECFEHDQDLFFLALTGAAGIEQYTSTGIVRNVPIETERLEQIDDAPQPMTLVQSKYVTLLARSRRLERLQNLHAPAIIVQNETSNIQTAFDELVAAIHGTFVPPSFFLSEWRPTPGGTEPSGYVLNDYYPRVLRDVYVADVGIVISYEFITLVVDYSGTIVDRFPTMGLRPVGHRYHDIYFVMGGFDELFEPWVYQRDTASGAWSRPTFEDPFYIAGLMPEADRAAVIDVTHGVGFWLSDFKALIGVAIVSADGQFAYDQCGAIVQCSSGEPILDLRHFDRDYTVTAFVRSNHAWRFAILGDGETFIVDEMGASLGSIPFDTVCFDAAGLHIAGASPTKVSNYTIPTSPDDGTIADPSWTIDLRDVEGSLSRFDSKILHAFHARWGIAELYDVEDLLALRQSMKILEAPVNWEKTSDETLQSELEIFLESPPLPENVPFGR